MDVIKIKEEIQREAELAHIAHNYRSTCCLGTGLGKTILLMNRISDIVSRNPDAKIIVSGAREVYITNTKNEFVKFERQDLLDKITFVCNRSLKNFRNEHWDFVCIDESHKEIDLYLSFLQYALYNNPTVEILCLTGTPKPVRFAEELYSIVPISYVKRVDESIERGILNDYRIHIFNYDLKGNDFKNYKFWHDKLRNGLLSGSKFPFEIMRIKAIFAKSKQKVEYFEKFRERLQGYKTLVFANSIEQAESLNIPVLHSKLSKSEKEDVYQKFYDDDVGMLANVGMLKESVSIPGLTRGFVLNIESSEQSFHQLLGRFCRLSTEKVAHLIILCAQNTVERKWLINALSRVEKEKIKEYNLNEWI